MSDIIERRASLTALPLSRTAWRIGANRPPLRVAVLIPCCDEEATIAQVIAGFQATLPWAVIYVYDNNSADRTAFVARAAGAEVRTEQLQGKGHVVRRMFADIDADAFILVDGDDTYDPAVAPAMLEMLLERQLDMVTATRIGVDDAAYRPGHRLGNAVLSNLVRVMFGDRVTDVLSGYRVFSRRFVKSYPALAGGFEIETEFTVHALQLEMPLGEIATRYRERPKGSLSKLHTVSDGLRIIRMILVLVKEGRPLQFFAAAGSALLLAALLTGGPLVMEFFRTGLVPRLPSAVLATGLVLLSSLTWVCGVVLDSVERGRKEMKRLAYLAIPLLTPRDD